MVFAHEQGEILQFSPKRELQNFATGLRVEHFAQANFLELSDLVSRSSEIGSPKRGRDETWAC